MKRSFNCAIVKSNTQNPKDRISARDALRHPFILNFNPHRRVRPYFSFLSAKLVATSFYHADIIISLHLISHAFKFCSRINLLTRFIYYLYCDHYFLCFISFLFHSQMTHLNDRNLAIQNAQKEKEKNYGKNTCTLFFIFFIIFYKVVLPTLSYYSATSLSVCPCLSVTSLHSLSFSLSFSLFFSLSLSLPS